MAELRTDSLQVYFQEEGGGAKDGPSVSVFSAIDFDEYEGARAGENEEASEEGRWAVPHSTLVTREDDLSRPDDLKDLRLANIDSIFPANVLRTFQLETNGVNQSRNSPSASGQQQQQQQQGASEQSHSVILALVNAVARAMDGDSVVTAPVLFRGFPWLGKITVKPGTLKGTLFVSKHRTYNVQAQVLAGGHVLPWIIGRTWRYSELRKLLVDDLVAVARKNELLQQFEAVANTFPPKTWQHRNSDEIAEYRGKAIEGYIARVINMVGLIIDQREAEKSSKKGRRSQRSLRGAELVATGELSSAAVSASAATRKNSLDAITGDGLGEIMSLIVSRLLNIDSQLRQDISKVSIELAALITSAPTDHCHVTKEFKITPQQAL